MARPRGIGIPNLGRLSAPPGAKSPAWKLINAGTSLNTRLYRVSGGFIGGRIGNAPVLLLHHVGRKTGRPRVSPLLYLPDGDRMVVVASNGGATAHPAWYRNLLAAPATQVEVGRDRREVVAREITEEERERYWPRLVEIYPSYALYQQRTDRQIPVVVLEPAARR
jgi:F420H(2)-dependent quinone reductase